MNLIMDEAEEVYIGKKKQGKREIGASHLLRRSPYFNSSIALIIGRILLKGDNITLIQPVQV